MRWEDVKRILRGKLPRTQDLQYASKKLAIPSLRKTVLNAHVLKLKYDALLSTSTADLAADPAHNNLGLGPGDGRNKCQERPLFVEFAEVNACTCTHTRCLMHKLPALLGLG